ncbi:MAG: hypothetical protein BWY78_01052 [Alphaproteobacteria bacterium ADurb.Bin438]|nr:MAG: hypothetical protein BWY78_01052 [Alphaproteobacteria bacterium ADurb.Bin438]
MKIRSCCSSLNRSMLLSKISGFFALKVLISRIFINEDNCSIAPGFLTSVVITPTLRFFLITALATNLAVLKVFPAPGAPTIIKAKGCLVSGKGLKRNKSSIALARAITVSSVSATLAIFIIFSDKSKGRL